MQREVQILHHLGGHASVVTLHDVFEDKKQVRGTSHREAGYLTFMDCNSQCVD